MINDPDHRMHEDEHPHVHSPACGHESRKHGDHDDYDRQPGNQPGADNSDHGASSECELYAGDADHVYRYG